MDIYNYSFRKVGKYQMSNMCLQSYPCKHIIKFETGEKTARKFFEILLMLGFASIGYHLYYLFQ